MRLADTIGTSRYAKMLARIYPKLENISVDYAILEPATRPLGSAEASLYCPPKSAGAISARGRPSTNCWRKHPEKTSPRKAASFRPSTPNGNFFWSPKKFVAAIGVQDLVVVETEDALLICPRERAQDVGKIVKWLEEAKLENCCNTRFEAIRGEPYLSAVAYTANSCICD